MKWRKGQVVTVIEKVSGDYWEVKYETPNGTQTKGGIKPWRLCEYQPGSKGSCRRMTKNEIYIQVTIHQLFTSS